MTAEPLFLLLVKVTFVLFVALMGRRIAYGTRASVRHLILAAAFVGLAAVPTAIRFIPEIPIEIPNAGNELTVATLMLPDFTNRHVVEGVHAAAVSPKSGTVTASMVVTSAWALSVFVGLVPMLIGCAQLARVRRWALPWVAGQLRLDAIRSEFQLSRKATVVISEGCPGPITFGIWHAFIVFPPEARQWTYEDVRRAMIHELEHVRRWDCLTDAIARLVCAAYWFHPLVWIALWRLRLDAERACDDAVLRTEAPVAYAEQLVALAERLAGHRSAGLLRMASRNDLSMRVRGVLDGAQRRGSPGPKWIAGITVVTFVTIVSISPLRAVASKQTQSSITPGKAAFEVASIKENRSSGSSPGGTRFHPGGRFTARNATLRDLVMTAYSDEFARSQVTGFTGWMDEMRFDVDAKPSAGVVADGELTRERAQLIREMVRSLLAERFELRLHREDRTGDVHVLSIGPGGPKLTSPKPVAGCGNSPEDAGRTQTQPTLACHMVRIGRRGLDGLAVDSADLAGALQSFLERPVVDRVKLPGLYEMTVRWNAAFLSPRFNGPSAQSSPDSDDPDVYTALREQLGLKLEVERGQLPMLIIDSAKMPEEN